MKKPAQHLIAEVPRRQAEVEITIGIDLGDVWSHYCTLNQDGEVVDRGRFRTTAKAIEKWFTDVAPARVAMEAGTHSIWISAQLQELGHEVIVANVRELRAISHSDRKSDQVDAEKLARYARLDPNILRPIAHRTVAQQEALTLIRARALLVRLRTAAVNAVGGLTKSCGYRMPASATTCFAQRSLAVMPPGLAQALGPILQQIAEMTVKIKLYDRQIQQLGQTEYPATQSLLKVHGVGHLTALTFVLTLGSKERFGRSRDAGCYLGLRPRRSQSGDHDPQLGITHAGNAYLRSLLIECYGLCVAMSIGCQPRHFSSHRDHFPYLCLNRFSGNLTQPVESCQSFAFKTKVIAPDSTRLPRPIMQRNLARFVAGFGILIIGIRI